MTEAKERLVEDEKRQNQRPLISAVAGIASAAVGLLVGSVLHLILSPIEWAQVIESVSFEITNGFDRRRFIASAGFREFSKQIEWAEYLLSFTGGIISIVISLATICVVQFWLRLRRVDRMTFELLERANDVENHIGNLENRHNIIHHGTQYGKVLALQTLYKADVPSPFEPYTRYLGEDHCIVSTLIADRFEELLTSEHYMNFFFDLSLPKGGYFRLVIAREPKDFEALSVYATLSKKLAYQTAILPYPRWENTVKEALRAVLDPKTFTGVNQLIEGQTELGIASSTLDSLDSLSPSGSNFLGRIQKDRKVEGFSKRNLKGIELNAVQVYWRLMAQLRQHYRLQNIDSSSLRQQFAQETYQHVVEQIRETLGAAK